MPESLVPTLLAPFATLEDPRIDRTRRYKLLDIIFIALCAVVSGANDCVAMEKFGKSKRPWLEKYLSLPDSTPCHDTFTRVFTAMDGEAFVACFLKWVEALQEATDGQLVAIDGKTARATLDKAKGKPTAKDRDRVNLVRKATAKAIGLAPAVPMARVMEPPAAAPSPDSRTGTGQPCSSRRPKSIPRNTARSWSSTCGTSPISRERSETATFKNSPRRFRTTEDYFSEINLS